VTKISKNSLFQSISKAFKEKNSGNQLAQFKRVKPSQTQSNQIQPYPPAMNAYPTKSEYIRPNPTNFFRMLETFHRYGFPKAPKGL